MVKNDLQNITETICTISRNANRILYLNAVKKHLGAQDLTTLTATTKRTQLDKGPILDTYPERRSRFHEEEEKEAKRKEMIERSSPQLGKISFNKDW